MKKKVVYQRIMCLLAAFPDDPFNQPLKETEPMKRSELHYRTPRNESFPSRHRTSQPQPSGSVNDDTENRIVMLYNSGQSIEAVTREVGRARHLIVHILQTRGVFGNRQPEPIGEESRNELLAVEDIKEELVIEEPNPAPLAVNRPGHEIDVEEPPRKVKSVRRPKSPEPLKSVTAEKPRPKPPAVNKTQHTGRWSPLVVDALCKVATQLDLNPGMSLEEVHKMVSESNC
jgi:hypothetical protein